MVTEPEPMEEERLASQASRSSGSRVSAAKRAGPDAGGGLVTVERQLVNQKGDVVQEGETEHLLERRRP